MLRFPESSQQALLKVCENIAKTLECTLEIINTNRYIITVLVKSSILK